MSDYLMVASIDFGTTYSGYAFSLTTDFKRDPLLIHSNQTWNSGTAQLLSLKTPTCILLNSNRKTKSIVYEAESDYSRIKEEDNENQEDYYFFHRFKMILYDNEVLALFKMQVTKYLLFILTPDILCRGISIFFSHRSSNVNIAHTLGKLSESSSMALHH